MTEINSCGDFMKMQEQAIKRIREMEKKSAFSIEETENEIEAPQEKKPAPPPEDKGRKKTEKPPVISSKKKSEKAAPPKKSEGASPLSALLSLDSDKSLILPLLLFLGKEGVDDMLLLALLYIMS